VKETDNKTYKLPNNNPCMQVHACFVRLVPCGRHNNPPQHK